MMKNITPPSLQESPGAAARVMRRSLVLASIVCRGSIDTRVDQPDAIALHQRMLEWLTRSDLWSAVEPSEAKMLQAPLGSLPKDDVIRATWRVEGLAVLGWALGQCEFPIHDQKVDPFDVAEAAGFLYDDIEEEIRTAQLRDLEQQEACRELLYAIHVRLRDFLRHRKSEDITGWIETSWTDALNIDPADLIVDKDLSIDKKPITEVALERVQECEWVMTDRHRAIIWLVEDEPTYSDISVDT